MIIGIDKCPMLKAQRLVTRLKLPLGQSSFDNLRGHEYRQWGYVEIPSQFHLLQLAQE